MRHLPDSGMIEVDQPTASGSKHRPSDSAFSLVRESGMIDVDQPATSGSKHPATAALVFLAISHHMVAIFTERNTWSARAMLFSRATASTIYLSRYY